jgi:hypothetical protein
LPFSTKEKGKKRKKEIDKEENKKTDMIVLVPVYSNQI